MEKVGRPRRIHIPNTVHHVMIRGNNRQQIFFTHEDFNRFLQIILESSKKFDHKIIAYCLMTNHVHLLVYINNSPLSSVMQKINYSFARWINKKEKRIGHLFQGRYKSLHVKDDTYLVNVFRYIHFNPVAAKIVNEVENYPWSSHHYYIKNNFPEWLKADLILDSVKNKTNLSYQDFINQAVDRNAWKPAMYISKTGEMVYDNDTLHKYEQEYDVENLKKNYLRQEKVMDILCSELNIQKSILFGTSKNHNISKQRILIANYLLLYAGQNITDVAKKFNRTQGTFSRQLQQFKEQSEKYFPREFFKKIELKLKDYLSEG